MLFGRWEDVMNSEELIQSIYLGDRGCKAINIDCIKKRVSIQVDCISRLRPGAQNWDYYTDRDIEDGLLVFIDVRSIIFDPPGPIPNDYIMDFTAKPLQLSEDQKLYLFTFAAVAMTKSDGSYEVLVKIEASRLHLEDPRFPGVEIID